jgi:small subunit ribosomal protein S17
MEGKPHRKRRVGVIVSDKMDKTVVVAISKLIKHARYHKFVRRRVKYKAHDEQNHFRTGDTVEIEETRPLSREKRWRVVRLVERPPEA